MKHETVPVPQYARSKDPAVIAAIKALEAVREEFHQAAIDFASKYGADRYFGGGDYFRGLSCSGIGGKDKPQQGQWKRIAGGRGWGPYKSNPIEQERAALSRRLPEIPGVKKGIYDAVQRGQTYWVTPGFFVHDGVAYVSFSLPCTGPRMGEQWEEIKASEWYAAHEASDEATS